MAGGGGWEAVGGGGRRWEVVGGGGRLGEVGGGGAPSGLASRRSSLRPARMVRVLDSGVTKSMSSRLSSCTAAASSTGTRGPSCLPSTPPTGKASMKAPPMERPWKMPRLMMRRSAGEASVTKAMHTGYMHDETAAVGCCRWVACWVGGAAWCRRTAVDEVRHVEKTDGAGGRLDEAREAEAKRGPRHQGLAALDVREGGEEADAEERQRLVHRLHVAAQQDRGRGHAGGAIRIDDRRDDAREVGHAEPE